MKSHWNWKDARSNTALHIAAQEGNLEVCRRLLFAGALVRARNVDGHTPADLANGKHNEVFKFLRNLQNINTMRGGTGDAVKEALADNRSIVKVDWYTIPLDGGAGTVGILHSLLSITVDGKGR